MTLISQLTAALLRIGTEVKLAKRYRYTLVVERKGGLRDNRYEWSYGDGLETAENGVVLTRDTWLVDLSAKIRQAPTRTCILAVERGTATIASLPVAIGASTARTTFSPIFLPAGSYLKAKTISGGKGRDATLGYELESTM